MNPHISHHKVVMVPCASIPYIWEWSIHYSSLSAIFTPLHNSTNQELFKKCICNQSIHYDKNTMVPHAHYHLKLKLSAMFNPLHSRNCLKSTKSRLPQWKIWMISRYAKEPITCNHQINAFHCQQRWMGHKGVTPWRMHGKYCGMQKGTSWAEAMSNSEKIKLVT